LIGFWNQQSVQSASPKVPVPTGGRGRKWEVPSSSSLPTKKWESASSPNSSSINKLGYSPPISPAKLEVPTVICTPPVNKWKDPGESGGFVRGLESGRVHEESERSDGREGGGKENMRRVVTKADKGDGTTSLGKPSQRPVSWSPQTYSGSPPKDLSYIKASQPIASPFAKFQQLEQQLSKSNPEKKNGSFLCRNSSLPASPRLGGLTTPSKGAVRSSSGAKELILTWVQTKLKNYPIPMTNFSSCWNDGLAFCALIHVFYPDNFDWFSLKAENRRYNFTLAFDKAEELADIYPLLEVEDMVRFQNPDWKCVFTYVQSFFRRFREDRIKATRHPAIGNSSSQVPSLDSCQESSTKETTKGEVHEIVTREGNIKRSLSHPDISKLVTLQGTASPNQDNTIPSEEISEEEENHKKEEADDDDKKTKKEVSFNF